ncbi:MAG: hypothetical protein J3Q66DRAFT_418774 [Benniella sp.]|nr:MAG: hypothetical protein J3Q66DRAFT_418774 [Benniella sp.]
MNTIGTLVWHLFFLKYFSQPQHKYSVKTKNAAVKEWEECIGHSAILKDEWIKSKDQVNWGLYSWRRMKAQSQVVLSNDDFDDEEEQEEEEDEDEDEEEDDEEDEEDDEEEETDKTFMTVLKTCYRDLCLRKEVLLPSEEELDPMMKEYSEHVKNLYRYARGKMEEFQQSEKKRGVKDVIPLKRASVALSCTLDTNHPEDKIFDKIFRTTNFIAKAQNACPIKLKTPRGCFSFSTFKNDCGDNKSLTACIKKCRIHEDKNGTAQEPWGWKEGIEVMEHLRKLVFEPFFESPASEGDIICEWKGLLHPFATKYPGIRTRSGECISKASRVMKKALDKEIGGFGPHGRRVDLLFFGDKKELCNVEFKSTEKKERDCLIQFLKNIRLNRAIMEFQFKMTGVRTALLYMNVCGWKGTLYALYEFEGIIVSKEIHVMTLPTTSEELKVFVQGRDMEYIIYFIMYLEMLRKTLSNARHNLKGKGKAKSNVARDATPDPDERGKRSLLQCALSPTKKSKPYIAN